MNVEAHETELVTITSKSVSDNPDFGLMNVGLRKSDGDGSPNGQAGL
jgi:hypothetical protein